MSSARKAISLGQFNPVTVLACGAGNPKAAARRLWCKKEPKFLASMDDAGELGAVSNPPRHNDQPVFALSLLIVNQTRLSSLVPEFLRLKRDFYPGLIPPASHFLAAVLKEVKGADIRRDIATGSRNNARRAERFLSELVDLSNRCEIKVASKVFVKEIGQQISATSVYTTACQSLFKSLDLNVPVAHSIFTQMFRSKLADPFRDWH